MTVDTANEAVVTFHPQSRDAGLAILRSGGNAFDAFVAATMADYAVAAGGTSLAGALGVLVYDAKRGKVEYLDAEFNAVKKPNGQWAPGDPLGKAMLVPGAPAGLEALSRRYGRLSFAQCLAPAIRLARNGFALDHLYARHIELCAGTLRKSGYGRRTFFRRGLSLQPGDVLRQPQLAQLLQNLARNGAAEMYEGPWAARFVKTVRDAGGLMSLDDMARYRAAWRQPWRTTYRGHTLFACSGRTFGGVWTLVGLKALERTDLPARGHWSRSADALEILVRAVRAMWEELWLLDYRHLDDRAFVIARLTSRYGARIWKRIAKESACHAKPTMGSHSYHVIVRDRDGNLASGTHTHESLAWGAGTFINGVPIPASGYLPWNTRPGQRRISPFSIVLAFRDDAPRFATGSFSSSILEASLQLLVNLIDYGYAAHETTTLPRLGTYPHNPADFLSAAVAHAIHEPFGPASNWLDARVPARIVAALERRGLALVPGAARRRRDERRRRERNAGSRPLDDMHLDTGLGAVLTVAAGGRADGAATPWPMPPRPRRRPARRERKRCSRL
jgi:gamma-glutamyltranspeptidase/glutathione hydrolase